MMQKRDIKVGMKVWTHDISHSLPFQLVVVGKNSHCGYMSFSYEDERGEPYKIPVKPWMDVEADIFYSFGDAVDSLIEKNNERIKAWKEISIRKKKVIDPVEVAMMISKLEVNNDTLRTAKKQLSS